MDKPALPGLRPTAFCPLSRVQTAFPAPEGRSLHALGCLPDRDEHFQACVSENDVILPSF